MLLEDQIVLVNRGVLRVGSKIHDAWLGWARRRVGDDVRVRRRPRLIVEYRERELPGPDPRIGDGVRDRRVDDAAVVDSPAAAQERVALAGNVPVCADPRPKVVLVAWKGSRQWCEWVGDLRAGHLLEIVAETEIERQMWVNMPGILDERGVVDCSQLERGRADSLVEARVETPGAAAQLRVQLVVADEVDAV